jgi:IS1 family transposase
VVVRKVQEAELDEMWSFVGSKRHPCWCGGRWLISQGMLAYVFGRREDRALRQRKALLEPFGIRRFYTVGWGHISGIELRLAMWSASGHRNSWSGNI